MVALANNPDLRAKLGRNAQEHIRQLADPGDSIERVEEALRLAISNKPNPHAAEDSLQALSAAHYLDHEQFGHTWREQMALRPLHYRVRFHQWRRVVRSRIASH
jgi:hypothetical protein